MKVVIIGATNKPERFAYRAHQMLIDHGHETYPVSLRGDDILDRKGYQSVADIDGEELPIDTVTVYLNPSRFEAVAEEVMDLEPKRVIFNPGTETPAVYARFREAGIEVVQDCTLIMLDNGSF